MKTNYLLKLLLGTIILYLLNFLYDIIFSSNPTLISIDILWNMLSSLFVVVILGFYVSYSTLRGIGLSLAVFLIYFIIGCFNILIEAYIFNVTDRTVTINEILQGLIIAFLFAPIFVYIFKKWDGHATTLCFNSRSMFVWIWRIFLGVFLYLIFYLTAGIILQSVYPGLMDFYKDKIPPFDVMIFTQFPRGILFAFIAILILRTLNLSLLKKAVFVGLVFSVLGAIAPLIPPNELMPSNIRIVHGIEVGISNFVYGLVLSYLLAQKPENKKVNVANSA